MKNNGKISLSKILRLSHSVFMFKELLLRSPEEKSILLKRRLNYYVQKGELYSIRRGLYAKDKNYDRLEVATKIFTPAYVSFETILAEAGIIFQYYSTIFVASYQSKEIICDGRSYTFRKIKGPILTNRAGLEDRGAYYAATKERAYLDVLYLNKDYYFDNLYPLDFEKVFALLPMYNNKRMVKKVTEQFENFKKKEAEL